MTAFIAFCILSVMTCLVIASVSGLLNYVISWDNPTWEDE